MQSAQSGDCVLPPAGARRYEASHRGIEGEHRAQCARVRRWREEHTLVKRQSWGPSNDGGLRIVNWESQSKTPPPESGRRTHSLYFTYSYCILSRVWKLATSLLVLWYYKHLFLFSMLKHVTSSRFCLYLLNIYHFTYTFSHARTEAHTHIGKHTCTISTQEEWRQPGTGAWLREVGERLW